MKHKEFMEKMGLSQRVAEFWRGSGAGGFSDTAKKFAITPMVAGAKIKFMERHLSDPWCPDLEEESHSTVCSLAKVVDLSTKDALRGALLARFKANPAGPMKAWPKEVSKQAVKKVMRISGLRWFEQNGIPYVHWAEK